MDVSSTKWVTFVAVRPSFISVQLREALVISRPEMACVAASLKGNFCKVNKRRKNPHCCKSGFGFPVAGKEKSESDGEVHQPSADLKFIFTVATQRTQEGG